VKGQVTQLVKATNPYQSNTIGIVSNNHNNFTSAGYNIKQADNPMPVALNGRVPVNVSASSSPIQPGDYLTTSADSGKAMKANGAGFVIGKALAAWDPTSGQTQVMVFVEPGYWPGPSAADTIQNGGDASLTDLTVSGNLTVQGLATVQDLQIYGHIITAGGQPVASVQTAAGTSATVSISGTDTIGTITITTGSTPTAGDLAQILFSKTYAATPHAVVSRPMMPRPGCASSKARPVRPASCSIVTTCPAPIRPINSTTS